MPGGIVVGVDRPRAVAGGDEIARALRPVGAQTEVKREGFDLLQPLGFAARERLQRLARLLVELHAATDEQVLVHRLLHERVHEPVLPPRDRVAHAGRRRRFGEELGALEHVERRRLARDPAEQPLVERDAEHRRFLSRRRALRGSRSSRASRRPWIVGGISTSARSASSPTTPARPRSPDAGSSSPSPPLPPCPRESVQALLLRLTGRDVAVCPVRHRGRLRVTAILPPTAHPRRPAPIRHTS